MSYGDPAKYITEIYVAEEAAKLAYTGEIIDRSGLPVTFLPTGTPPAVGGFYPDNLTRGKRALFLCLNRGNFFKSCPGTREYRCCDYYVLNIGMNCPMDCVYCILQAYLNNPWLSFFVNTGKLFAELEKVLQGDGEFYRIGTGEFTDSLALDRLTGLSRQLVPFFAGRHNAVLELKTKSAVIDNLGDLDHGGRTILAWSLNAPAIMKTEEIRTASLAERLAAAKQCAQWGYKLAFHFDPVIHHSGWQQGYQQTIEELFAVVPAEKIVWISIGALRYLPALKNIAARRFPASCFFYEEFIDGLDGKSRYFRTLREEMYMFLVGELQKRVAAGTCLYFCMESDTVWQRVFGYVPAEKGGLPAMLDRAFQKMT